LSRRGDAGPSGFSSRLARRALIPGLHQDQQFRRPRRLRAGPSQNPSPLLGLTRCASKSPWSNFPRFYPRSGGRGRQPLLRVCTSDRGPAGGEGCGLPQPSSGGGAFIWALAAVAFWKPVIPGAHRWGSFLLERRSRPRALGHRRPRLPPHPRVRPSEVPISSSGLLVGENAHLRGFLVAFAILALMPATGLERRLRERSNERRDGVPALWYRIVAVDCAVGASFRATGRVGPWPAGKVIHSLSRLAGQPG